MIDHKHREHSDPRSNQNTLKFVFILTAVYMVAEIFGGLWSGSLALIADAGHMATDGASVLLSLLATWIASKPADDDKTFGYHRAEILAALLNGAALIAIAIWILFEAWTRFQNPGEINAPAMALVATGGLVVNLVSLRFLHRAEGHTHDNLNLHGVWLHVASDALGSISALVAAFLVWKFHWVYADSISSVLIALLILVGAIRLVLQCVDVLLESVPKGVNISAIRSGIQSIRSVSEVHDLHVWAMTNGIHAMSAHVCVTDDADHATLLKEITGLLKSKFGIDHATVQLEPPSFFHSPLHS